MSAATEERAVSRAPANPGMERLAAEDPLRLGAYVVIAMLAFVTGFILGQLSAQAPLGSRIDWPPPPPAKPHPRALQM
jgi:hypothetical protein